MTARERRSEGLAAGAFSLVEVVVAVGVFVGAVVVALGLLTATASSARSTLETNTAVRVAQSAQALVRQWTWKQAMDGLDTNAPAIFATRDGNTLSLVAVEAVAADAAPFYQVELSRNGDFSPAANDETAGYLALRLRVSWPARTRDGQLLPMDQRDVLTFNVAVRR